MQVFECCMSSKNRTRNLKSFADLVKTISKYVTVHREKITIKKNPVKSLYKRR